jgi:hypothetical protein
MALENIDHVHQQIAEIARVQDFQPRLIDRVELHAAAIGERERLRSSALSPASARGSSSRR